MYRSLGYCLTPQCLLIYTVPVTPGVACPCALHGDVGRRSLFQITCMYTYSTSNPLSSSQSREVDDQVPESDHVGSLDSMAPTVVGLNLA